MLETHEVVLLYKNGDRVTGRYDGYGRVRAEAGGTVDGLHGGLDNGTLKIVLKKFIKPKDTFESIGKNHHEPGQGHFHQPGAIMKWYAAGGFKTYKAYVAAYDRL
jgi:hypothetical protein